MGLLMTRELARKFLPCRLGYSPMPTSQVEVTATAYYSGADLRILAESRLWN